MSTLADIANKALETAMKHKARQVREARDLDATTMLPVIQGWRGDREVAVLIPMDAGREEALDAVKFCAIGFGCDTITMTNDSWFTAGTTDDPDSVVVNPLTGKRWQRDEMQDAVRNHGALEKGWIRQGLNTMAVNRAGDLTIATMEYRTPERRSPLGFSTFTLEWGEGHPAGEESRAEGYQPEVMVDLMNRTSVHQAMLRAGLGPELFELTPVQAQAHADCAVVKMLPRLGWAGGVILTSDDPERTAVIDESLAQRGYGGWA